MRYQRKQDVVARTVAGEHILIPVQGCTRSVYTLNPTGCHLWDLLGEEKSADDLADALVGRHAIPRETACHDVAAFLQELSRMGLIIQRD
jgi:hypothetical protein